jgi:hypothetical protein
MPEIIGDSVKVIGAELARDAFKKQAEAMASIFRDLPQSAFATALNRRKSHRDYCLVRNKRVTRYLKTEANKPRSIVVEWTTDIQAPIDRLDSSSLRCNGPPAGLVSELSSPHQPTPVGLGQGRPSR